MSDMAREHIPALTLGWRLKMALGDHDAQDMAADLGVHRATVARWMADKGAPPRAAYIKQWALITGTDVRWLLTGQQTAPHPVVPDEGLKEQCAVRESNPQPADIGSLGKDLAKVLEFPLKKRIPPRRQTPAHVIPLRPDRLADVIPLRQPALSYVAEKVAA